MGVVTMDAINVQLYSLLGNKTIGCRVLRLGDNVVQLISNDLELYKDAKGIPVILGSSENGYMTLHGGYIAHKDRELITIKLNRHDIYTYNRRKSERLYTSLEADIRNTSKKRQLCYIKDISLEGLRIITPVPHEVGQLIDMEVYNGAALVGLCGILKWSLYDMESGVYEEGLDLTYINRRVYTYMRSMANQLEEKYCRIFDIA
jgi:hypothetical protein